MEKLSTGFPDLDAILGRGLPKPSCLSIQGDLYGDQMGIVYQLIYNFLQKGLKGLYISLDRPADEIRQNFKKLNLDISAYDQDYRIFFIDFFEESQKALIETSTIDALAYEPNKFLRTLTPFLEWIKNGFMIIDSVSTLALNMDVKEGYDLIRGVKIVGRVFNLISIGIVYNVTASKIVDTLCTNSEGTLLFKDKALFVERFDQSAEEY